MRRAVWVLGLFSWVGCSSEPPPFGSVMQERFLIQPTLPEADSQAFTESYTITAWDPLTQPSTSTPDLLDCGDVLGREPLSEGNPIGWPATQGLAETISEGDVPDARGLRARFPYPSEHNPWGARIVRVQARAALSNGTRYEVQSDGNFHRPAISIAEWCTCVRGADADHPNAQLDAHIESSCQRVEPWSTVLASLSLVDSPTATADFCGRDTILAVPGRRMPLDSLIGRVCSGTPPAVFLTRIDTPAGPSPWEMIGAPFDLTGLTSCDGAYAEVRPFGQQNAITRVPLTCLPDARLEPRDQLTLAADALIDVAVLPATQSGAPAQIVALIERDGSTELVDVSVVGGVLTRHLRAPDPFLARERGIALHPLLHPTAGPAVAVASRSGGDLNIRVIEPRTGRLLATSRDTCQPESCGTGCSAALSCGLAVRADDTVTMRTTDIDRDGTQDLAVVIDGDTRLFRFLSTSTAALARCACSDHGRPIHSFDLADLGGTDSAAASDLIVGDGTGVYVQYARIGNGGGACLSCGAPLRLSGSWTQNAVSGHARLSEGPFDSVLLFQEREGWAFDTRVVRGEPDDLTATGASPASFGVLAPGVGVGGDYNGDGFDDLAMSEGRLFLGHATDDVALVLPPAVPLIQCTRPGEEPFISGDLDGDGRSDLLVACIAGTTPGAPLLAWIRSTP